MFLEDDPYLDVFVTVAFKRYRLYRFREFHLINHRLPDRTVGFQTMHPVIGDPYLRVVHFSQDENEMGELMDSHYYTVEFVKINGEAAEHDYYFYIAKLFE